MGKNQFFQATNLAVFSSYNFLVIGSPFSFPNRRRGQGNKTVNCNCNRRKCQSLRVYNCTSRIGCFASFYTSPYKAIYGCIEDMKGKCEYELAGNKTRRVQIVFKCCYEDNCNHPHLIEQYFPTERKYTTQSSLHHPNSITLICFILY